MYQRVEKIIGPIGPLDVQIHRSSLVDELDIMLRSAVEEAAREHSGKPYNGYTYEIIPDGAGVKHYNLIVHFATLGKALDPTNMNDAPKDIFGNTLDHAELAKRGVGRWENHWRGWSDPGTGTGGQSEMGKLQAGAPSAVDGKR